MTPITALGSRYGIQGALGRSVKRASTATEVEISMQDGDLTTLIVSAPTRCYGQFCAIRGATLMRYDVSSLSSAVLSAKIVFTRTNTITAVKTYNSIFYGLASANAGWVSQSSKPAASGICCWNAKEADGSGGVTTAWAGSAGCQTAGTDYINTAIGTLTYYRAGTSGTTYELVFNNDGIALVNSWISNSANNYGIMTPNQEFSAVTMDPYPPLIVTY